jgi:hypothetical protein
MFSWFNPFSWSWTSAPVLEHCDLQCWRDRGKDFSKHLATLKTQAEMDNDKKIVEKFNEYYAQFLARQQVIEKSESIHEIFSMHLENLVISEILYAVIEKDDRFSKADPKKFKSTLSKLEIVISQKAGEKVKKLESSKKKDDILKFLKDVEEYWTIIRSENLNVNNRDIPKTWFDKLNSLLDEKDKVQSVISGIEDPEPLKSVLKVKKTQIDPVSASSEESKHVAESRETPIVAVNKQEETKKDSKERKQDQNDDPGRFKMSYVVMALGLLLAIGGVVILIQVQNQRMKFPGIIITSIGGCLILGGIVMLTYKN